MDAAARDLVQRDLRRLRDGDRAAARPVFDALWPVGLGLARALLHNDDDAKDATQAALIKLFAGVAAFDDGRSGVAWALAVVTWECRTLRKQRQRRREEPIPINEGVDVAAGVEAGVDNQLVAGLIRAADVARLVEAFVALNDLDQATLRAYLDDEGGSDATGRKRRQRALARLRALVFGNPAGDVVEPISGDPHV